LRVLHIAKFYPPAHGGMERVVEMLCRASTGMAESHVLAMHTGRSTVEEDVDGVHVVRVGVVGAAGSVHIAPSMAGWMRKMRADVTIFHEPNPWALLSWQLARPRMPLFLWYHSDVVRPALQYALFYAPLARPVYRSARRIIVSSPPLGERASVLRDYRDRIRVVPFAIEPAPWRADPPQLARAAAVVTEMGGPFVLFVGRHVPYKGVDVLLRALAGTDIRCAIAGDGPKRRDWQRLAGSLGLGGRVTFTGDVGSERLKTLMHAATALVLPSTTRAEAFGYVQLEAMAAGKPVIATDVPTGVSWVTEDGRTGSIVPAGDVERLRSAIQALLANPERAAALGAAGRRRVEREFTMERLRERLRTLYEEVHA
jgi:glycosyltransferase involved in cell wall biosynthesis